MRNPVRDGHHSGSVGDQPLKGRPKMHYFYIHSCDSAGNQIHVLKLSVVTLYYQWGPFSSPDETELSNSNTGLPEQD